MISPFAQLPLHTRPVGSRNSWRKLFVLCFGLLLFAGLVAQEAKAVVFTVTREDETLSQFGDCFSGGDCSLRQAINSSNAEPADDIIRFAPHLQRVVLSAIINNQEVSQPDILVILNGRLSIEGPGRNLLRIEGHFLTMRRIFDVRPGTSNAFSISGVTISGGRGRGSHSTFDRDSGGAILATDTALTLNDVALVENSTPFQGGAIALFWGQPQGTNNKLAVNITNSIITDNTAGEGCGGIDTRTSEQFLGQPPNTMLGGTLNVTNSVVSFNRTDGGMGGGLCSNWEFVNLTNSEVAGNRALQGGGGVFVSSAAIGVPATLTLRNSTLSGNAVTAGSSSGGAIKTTFGNLVLENATIVNNDALNGDGGGISLAFGQASMHNTIIAKNRDASINGGCPDICGEIRSDGYNFLGQWPLIRPQTSITGPRTGDIVSDNFSGPLDPLLGPLALNGGSTQNHAAPCNSRVINAGDPSIFQPTDQRGVYRPQGIRPDIGAYEATDCFTTMYVYSDTDAGPGSLRDAINQNNSGKTLLFSPTFFNQPRTIYLTSSEILINKNLTVDGPGANLLTIDAGNARGIFTISGVTLNLSGMRLIGGNRGSGSGGAIANFGTLNGSKISIENSSANVGGAIYNAGTLNLTQSTASGNSSALGGAIANNGTLSLINSTISGNTSSGKGGGIYNDFNRVINAVNSTITNNNSPNLDGGGIYSDNFGNGNPTISVRNTIIAGNISAGGVDFIGDRNDQGFNLIGGNPQLRPLGNYGGPTQTHAFSCEGPTSPAVNGGDPNNILATDQRDVARPIPVGGRPDIGAVEAGLCLATVTNNNASGAGSLRKAIADTEFGGTINFSPGATFISLAGVELLIDKNLTITGSTTNPVSISANQSSRIFLIPTGVTLNLSGLRLFNGRAVANNGGTILNFGTLNLSRVIFEGCSAQYGGCISSDGDLSVRHSIVKGGRALYGGGIFSAPSSRLTIENSTFSDNKAGDGGAMVVGGETTINNTTISGNFADTTVYPGGQGKGGGILLTGNTLTTFHTTITNNTAPSSGGGVYVEGGQYRIHNDLIAGNSAPAGPDAFGELTSFGYNLIGNTSGNFFNPNPPGGATLNGNRLNASALLAPLGDYGPCVISACSDVIQTHALYPGSEAINYGDPASHLPVDQRGVVRPNAGGIDIGAFESNVIFDQTSSLPHATRNVPYSFALTAKRQPGNTPVTARFDIIPIAGEGLPPFFFLSGGRVEGTTTTTGTFTFTVKARDTDGISGVQKFTLIVDPAVVYVSSNGQCGNSPCFTSLQAAIDAVATPGTVNVVGGTFNENITLNKNVTVNINGNTTINAFTISAGTLNGGNATLTLSNGNWTNNGGAFNPGGGTVSFAGSGQLIGGTNPTTFNGLTIGPGGVAADANSDLGTTSIKSAVASFDLTVNGILTLNGDLTVNSPFMLIMPWTMLSYGDGDVIGSVKRHNGQDQLPSNAVHTFGNPNNTIYFAPGGTIPTDVTVNLVKSAPAGFPNAVQRTYTITQNNGGGFSCSVQLRYRDSELGSNDENSMVLWRLNPAGTAWQQMGAETRQTTDNWVRQIHIRQFSQWILANASPTAADGTVSGRVLDDNGAPVAGVVVNLSGSQNRKTITNAKGDYFFENVETTGFYTVTPSRVNYLFTPSQRSFSQLGNHTEAAFTGSFNGTGASSPLDSDAYFVRQQYLDFLGREPDEAGFNFWLHNIESCGADQNCRSEKRVETSAAFFLSIEFQQTGYLVHRMYQTAYGDMPGAPVPLTLDEFKTDTKTIGEGVIVNQSGWEESLENNKRAFAEEFVQRSRFATAYPTSMTATDFVDRLFATAGVVPSEVERAAAISEFGSELSSSDVAARGRALRRVAENSQLAQQEFNQAFVLMQYLGYLGRNPNGAPEPNLNFDGFDFWLAKLDQFNDFRAAEMVKAFLVSGEYRARFPR